MGISNGYSQKLMLNGDFEKPLSKFNKGDFQRPLSNLMLNGDFERPPSKFNVKWRFRTAGLKS
jgi:hypothetical protein